MASRIRMQAGLPWSVRATHKRLVARCTPRTSSMPPRRRLAEVPGFPAMVYGRDTSRDELIKAAVRKIFESPRPGPSGSCNSLADQPDENSWPIHRGRSCSSSAHPVHRGLQMLLTGSLAVPATNSPDSRLTGDLRRDPTYRRRRRQ